MTAQKNVKLPPTISLIAVSEQLGSDISTESLSGRDLSSNETATAAPSRLIARWERNQNGGLICKWVVDADPAKQGMRTDRRTQVRNSALSDVVMIAWTKYRRR